MTLPDSSAVLSATQPIARVPAIVRRDNRPIAVAGLLLVAAVAGVATGALLGVRETAASTGGATSQAAEAPAAVLSPASIESVDPSGGSGFRQDGDVWRTQTYRSADFGKLKDGVGLLLDLGTAREVTSLTLDTATSGLAVELRAADRAAGDADGFRSVDSADQTAGTVTLSGEDAGAHRYWLVWVTRLGQADGGFAAEVSTPVIEGR